MGHGYPGARLRLGLPVSMDCASIPAMQDPCNFPNSQTQREIYPVLLQQPGLSNVEVATVNIKDFDAVRRFDRVPFSRNVRTPANTGIGFAHIDLAEAGWQTDGSHFLSCQVRVPF